MTTNDREIVPALRAHLAERLGQQRFDVWFGAATELALHGDVLRVSAPSEFHRDWLRSNYRNDLEAVCQQLVGRRVAVEFCVRSNGDAPGTAPSAAPAQPPSPSDPPQADSASPAAAGATAADPPPAPGRRFARLDTFVVGAGNKLAFTAAQMAAARPSSDCPLLIYGPTGVGKTHLLEGIWSVYRQARHALPALYLTAEQFTSHFVAALHRSGLPSFRRKVRDVGLLLIDDVQFFAGKRATLIELLHTVETLARSGRQLVLAADRSPSALKSLGAELIARLAGGVLCHLEPPDYATRLGIVGTLARQWSIDVPPAVAAFIAAHFTAHARLLAGALKRLHASSVALGRPITAALAEESLADLLHESQRPVQLADIEKVVVESFGLAADALQSSTKSKSASNPRMLAMWLARKHTRAALSEIGRYFGGRSHTTVISARKRIESLMGSGGTIDLADRAWKLEDAIRRVEQRLQAG